ncbi:MAG: type III secretion system inner rod subunit SctI [Verrucomicrobiota bacterium]
MSDFAISAITQQSTAVVAPLETGSESVIVRPGNVADPVDVARFESLIDPAGQPDAATAPAAVSPPSESGGLGNVILDGIEKMSSAYNNRVDAVNASVSDVGEGGMTVQETMKLQLELMQLNLQQDVTAKIADKTSQGIQTLFKNQ